MTQQNLITVLMVIASAVIPYLISQTDVPLPPVVIVALTAANIGLTSIARFSNGGAATTTITTSAPSTATVTTSAPVEEVPKP